MLQASTNFPSQKTVFIHANYEIITKGTMHVILATGARCIITGKIYKQCLKMWNELIPVIILTFTPRFRALDIVSALSCLGGSNRGMRPINCHGLPALSFLPSGTS